MVTMLQIRKHKFALKILWAALVAICVLIIIALYMASEATPIALSKFTLLLYMLPFLFLGIVHLILMSESWLMGQSVPVLQWFKRIFFAILSTTFVVVIVMLFLQFIL